MKYDRPGHFPTWRALWNEIVCNLFGCDWEPCTQQRFVGDFPLPISYPAKSCRRCRRVINA